MSTRTSSLSSGRTRIILLAALALISQPAWASYIGGEAPFLCLTCGAPPMYTAGASGGGFTEGNFRETPPAITFQSGSGPTVNFYLTYNSDNADGSHAEIDTVLGYGWTHSYNILLFSQVQNMFKTGEDGRTEKFQIGPGGTYTADPGYFDTLVKNGDGSFTLTDKYKTAYHFATVAGTPFIIGGPVYRLQTITDRNGNLTSLTYSSGELQTVTDTYGRVLKFTYNSSSHLTKVTDPLGRVTMFVYDTSGRRLSAITDANGRTTQYTYNTLNQFETKVDGDGRRYTYQYQANLPVGAEDGSSTPIYSLSNPLNWSTSSSALASEEERVYNPSTTTEVDGRGNIWKYEYEPHGYPSKITGPDGSILSFTYDPSTLEIASATDADGNTTKYKYDSRGNRTNTTDALGNVTSWTYEPVYNQITSMTDPNERVTTYAYDFHGNRTNTTDALGQTQSWTYDTHGNVLTATNKRGYTTQFKYDTSGNRTNMTDALGDVTSYSFDAVGNRTNLTDSLDRTTRYTYDMTSRLIKTTDPLGNPATTTYDATGDILLRTDANGHTTSYGYDLRDRVIAKTNAVGGTSDWTYDGDDNITSRKDENHHTTTYFYDTLNRMTNATDPLGHVRSRIYDPAGNVVSSTDANGHTTEYGYDALNRRISVIDPLGNITTYEYASSGGPACCGATGGSDLVTGTIDGDGKITYYHYDELNRRYQEVHKSGGSADIITATDAVATTTYDAENNRIAFTDPNDNTTTMTYDPLNRQIGITNAAGDISTIRYDPVGNVIQTTDARGNVTTLVYDADDRLIERTDSIGPVLGHSYDPVGNVISTTNGDGYVTSASYDGIDRVIQVTDPLDHSTTTAYDAVGNVVSTIDRNGNTTQFAYDADNRQTNVTDSLAHITRAVYDPVGNVVAIADALGHVTTNIYDADNRLSQETYADTPSDTRTYSYDGTGHVLSRLDQNGQTTSYQYNDFYYLTQREYSAGPSDQYTYDLGGRMTTASRNSWMDSFTYDGANRPLNAIQNGQSVAYSYVIPSGIRTIAYPSGTTITESHDLRSRLVGVNDGGSPTLTQYTYDLDDNVLTRTNRNGTLMTNTYNANDWVTQLIHSNETSLIAGFGYAYDNEGNKTYQMNQAAPADSESYAYDAIYRLTGFHVGTLSGDIVPSPLVAETWNLDAVGNWSTYVSNSVTQNRTHNAVNEILTISGSPNPSYDANGNVLNDGRYTYTYDVENRLTTVTRDSDAALVGQYAYDAMGRRITATLDPAGTPETKVMFYDGARTLEEQNASAVPQVDYTYGNYVDEVLTMERGGQTYYYHPNTLYNVEAVSDSTGAVAERYVYDVYGEPAVLDGTYSPVPLNPWGTPHSAIANEYFFTGRQLDEESGLYYSRARHYDSTEGRFLQRDPLDYTDSMDLYEYVSSRPTAASDPYGLASKADFEKACTDNEIPAEVCKAILEAADETWIVKAGSEQCQRWVATFEENLLARLAQKNLSLHGNGIGHGTTRFDVNAYAGLTTGHAVYTFMFRNGAVFHFDNGCLNKTHIATPADVPKGWTSTTEAQKVPLDPKKAPCGYYCCQCGQKVDWNKVLFDEEKLGPFVADKTVCKQPKASIRMFKQKELGANLIDLSNECSKRCGERRSRVVLCEDTDKTGKNVNRDDVTSTCLKLP